MKREGEKAEASILELQQEIEHLRAKVCLLYTSDAADE